eukprot:TRINITY_DN4269_c0_g1_i1.p1 TRINITY_DN4269_c0_g1~~TRINITY_DN4269_c0_g1_i1.p1  ORF type:complete len:311 (-),score=25.84 TRINITY_DN4269_c0_g1_i1:63-995(-)
MYNTRNLPDALANLSQQLMRRSNRSDSKPLVGVQIPLEYAPHMFLIPFKSTTIPPFTHTNTVIVQSAQTCLLVDPGANSIASPIFRDTLETLIPSSSELQVFLTHHHNDHVEALPIIASLFPSATVYAHSKTLERIASTSLKTIAIDPGHKFIITDCKSGEYSANIELEVVAGDGHTDGHLFLFEPLSRTLVAGDHIVGYGSVSLDPMCGDMAQYFATTHAMISLKPRLAFPAHGPPSYEPLQLLNQYLSHRTQRENEILAAIDQGAGNVEEILSMVYPGLDSRLRRPATSNILLHLRKLSAERRLKINL